MKEKKEKLSIIIAAVAVVCLIGFLFVIQMIQNNSQKKQIEQSSKNVANDTGGIYESSKHEADICINEVCADGWIELYNLGKSEIDLSGYILKVNDNQIKIGKNTTLKSGEYKVIDVDSLMIGKSNLVELYARREDKLDSCLADLSDKGQSYARTEDGVESFALMQPTKAKTNADAKVIDTDMPQFSVPSGFYSDKITVAISAKDNQKIYYTTDGTNPTTESELYSKPLTIEDRTSEENKWAGEAKVSTSNDYQPSGVIDKCTVLRAVAVDEDGNLSEIASATYGIKIGDKNAYENIPIISIVTDPDKLFDYYDGLYVLGRTYEDMIARDKDDEVYANYLKAWDTEAKVQFFGSDHYNIKNTDYKLQIYKDESTDLAQKSLMLSSDEESYVLSSCGYDYAMKSRQGIANAFLKDTNISIPSNMYVVFIEGEFWGEYQLVEPFDSGYVSGVVDKDSYKILTAVDGRTDDKDRQGEYDKLKEFVLENDMKSDGNYKKVCKMMDVESYANFICGSVFLGNYSDKLVEYMWKDSDDGLWKWAIGNQTNTLGGSSASTYSLDTYLRPVFDKNKFLSQLMKNSDFQKLFKNTMDKMCDEYFSEKNIDKVISDYTASYGKLVVATWNRFIGSYDSDSYKLETDNIKEFVTNRKDYIERYTEEFIENASK